MLINVYASDRGWLFSDILRHFERLGQLGGVLCPSCGGDVEHTLLGMKPPNRNAATCECGWSGEVQDCRTEVVASERPIPDADAWICVRTSEAAESPDLSRTVVQVHDLFNDYSEGSSRGIATRGAGAASCTHPDQADLMVAAGVMADRGRAMRPSTNLIRPIGALEAFKPLPRLPVCTSPPPPGFGIDEEGYLERLEDRPFTIGWCGRPFFKDGRDLKRSGLFDATVRLLDSVSVVICSTELAAEAMWNHISAHRVSTVLAGGLEWTKTGPAFYHSIDCLVATSESPAIPLPVFEALRCGVPVVSTRRSWPGLLELDDGETAEELAEAVRFVRDFPQASRQRAAQQQIPLAGYTMESWIEENIRLAERIAR